MLKRRLELTPRGRTISRINTRLTFYTRIVRPIAHHLHRFPRGGDSGRDSPVLYRRLLLKESSLGLFPAVTKSFKRSIQRA